jgi:CRP-like cAMP-binding protein
LKAEEPFFSQGDKADCAFYVQKDRAKLTVVAKVGKEATIALLGVGDFLGEESVAGVVDLRLATATAIVACNALKIERKEMICALHQKHAFSDVFLAFVL